MDAVIGLPGDLLQTSYGLSVGLCETAVYYGSQLSHGLRYRLSCLMTVLSDGFHHAVRRPSTSPTPSTKSSDATLKSLSASGYTLSPSFKANTTSYTVTVPSTATTIKLEGATNHSKATVSGLGNITLTGNETVATIKVTAEDGSVKTYTVKIEKEKQEEVKKSNDATLKKLDISGYTLTPTFKSNVNNYSMKVVLLFSKSH